MAHRLPTQASLPRLDLDKTNFFFVQGVLRQALMTRLVRHTLGQRCSDDLEMRRSAKSKKQIRKHMPVELGEEETHLPRSFMQLKVNKDTAKITEHCQYITLH
jgi:hypothetical protein